MAHRLTQVVPHQVPPHLCNSFTFMLCFILLFLLFFLSSSKQWLLAKRECGIMSFFEVDFPYHVPLHPHKKGRGEPSPLEYPHPRSMRCAPPTLGTASPCKTDKIPCLQNFSNHIEGDPVKGWRKSNALFIKRLALEVIIYLSPNAPFSLAGKGHSVC